MKPSEEFLNHGMEETSETPRPRRREVTIAQLRIPQPTIERLSAYLQCLRMMERNGTTTASSAEIASRTGINAAQFRKDLSYFGEFGTPGLGYDVKALEEHLSRMMGLHEPHLAVLVGAGNLGAALCAYPGFRDRGFKIVAVFDCDPGKFGKEIAGLQVTDVDDLPKINGELRAEIGIITVPAAAAQNVVDKLVASGIRAILNFAPTGIAVRSGIVVRNVDLTSELEVLSYYLRQK